MTVKELKAMVDHISAEHDECDVTCIKCADGYAISLDINGYFLTTVNDQNVLALTNLKVVPRK